MKLKDLVKWNEAKTVINYLLKNEDCGRFPDIYVAGYYKENGWYICLDNTSSHCWVEQTKSLVLARKWCLGKIEIDELYGYN